MSQPNAQTLMTSLAETDPVKAEVLQQLREIQTSASKAVIKQALDALLPLLNSVQDDFLKELLQLALLGTCVGFIERNLNPRHPDHQYIYPPLITDITQAYERLEKDQIRYDPNHLKFESYDYGVQWVYYLDWTLYMSQELY